MDAAPASLLSIPALGKTPREDIQAAVACSECGVEIGEPCSYWQGSTLVIRVGTHPRREEAYLGLLRQKLRKEHPEYDNTSTPKVGSVIAVRCPRCLSAPGRACVSLNTGLASIYYHHERRERYEQRANPSSSCLSTPLT
jgi:hypothetical protein